MYLERGKVLLTYGWDSNPDFAAQLTLTPDMAFHIPPGMWHRFKGLEESMLFEFSTHHSDKDVVRLGDKEAKDGADDAADEDRDENS